MNMLSTVWIFAGSIPLLLAWARYQVQQVRSVRAARHPISRTYGSLQPRRTRPKRRRCGAPGTEHHHQYGRIDKRQQEVSNNGID